MRRSSTLFRLSCNDLKARYASSFLGILWAFIMPLITILLFWYVFQCGFRNPPVGDAPYILWFSAGYIPWIFFSDIISSGCNCLTEYSFLVRKIRFDVSAIPLIKLVSSLFVHIFFIIFLCLMCLICRYRLTYYTFQIFYYTGCLWLLGLGLTWLLSSVTVFFKDLSSLCNVLIQVGFWVTPVMWDEETMVNDRVRRVLAVNPMHYIVTGYRDSLICHRWFWEKPVETVSFWAAAVFFLLAGRRVFRKLSSFFADEV